MKVGDYTVELVAADTKTPFKEHTAPDEQVYAEVEPDMDYYVSLGSNDPGGVLAEISVDGVYLGYQSSFTGTVKDSYKGKWERRGGRETMTALHFNMARQAHGVTANNNNMLTGKVEVKFFRRGKKVYTDRKDFTSASLTTDSTMGGKKCIKSTTNGSHSFDIATKVPKSSKSAASHSYRKGELLRTITLNYCSALGLIYHKILPPPPESDSEDDSVQVKREDAGRKKRKRTSDTSSAAVGTGEVSEENKPVVKAESGQKTVSDQKTYELVDLSTDD